ncbi:unnamed protein product [Alopecurus aequalis]
MEVAVVGVTVGAVLNNVGAKLTAVIAERASELGKLKDDVSSLKTGLLMIACRINTLLKGQPSDSQLISMTTMRELAYEIEDCLDRFLPCAACKGGAVPIGEVVDFVDLVGKLKKRLEDASAQIKSCDAAVAGQSVSTSDVASPADPVGIDKPKLEISGLLRGKNNLKVISIVGFGGSGKTTLARAVYNCGEVHEDFRLRAWVVASKHKDGNELLDAILQQLLQAEPLAVPQEQSQVSKIQQQIRDRLQRQDTRCLIVIDEMIRHNDWEPIQSFFSKLQIKIVLTTTLQSIGNTCTADRGYIYNMITLSDEDSKKLLKKMVPGLAGRSKDLAVGSDAIVHKCHGHPLALTSMANYLLTQEQSTLAGKHCKMASRLLCTHTDENTHSRFTELRQVLVNNYTDLNVDLKTCLLYTSLFPNGRPVSIKTITSRWLAEGYIDKKTERSPQEGANTSLEQLMDRNIIQPMDARNRGEAKTCKPNGVMHQFMLYKSISSNFIATSLRKPSNFRHLVIENNRNGKDHGAVLDARPKNLRKKVSTWYRKITSKGDSEELRPRSLAVFGSAEKDVYSHLLKCKLLRVLDLKECNDSLSKRHHKCIYKLLHLKYLTLGKSVSNLSDQMKGLHCLETLDLRKTDIEELPVEVISLPHLAHMFGKIKLQNISKENQETFQRRGCNLQTLSGVVVDNNSVFPELMDNMKKLSNVKIWCEITSAESNSYTPLSDAIHRYNMVGTDVAGEGDPRSLSLRLNDSSNELVCHRDGQYGLLTTLKLQGRPSQFREFVLSLTGLEELCLTSINLEQEDLAALGTLQLLVYLKLVQNNLAGLHIKSEYFESLQRLCLVVKEPRFPTIAEEALPTLTSIQLLCGGLKDLDGFKMENFKRLSEVALDSAVNPDTIKLWEDAANNSPNKRPRIVLLKKFDLADTRSAVKYVATDQIPSETQVQGTSTDQTPSGTPVQGMDTDQIQSEPLVQGVATNGIPLGASGAGHGMIPFSGRKNMLKRRPAGWFHLSGCLCGATSKVII